MSSFMRFSICASYFTLSQRYFAFVKLNVNWWDPCTLYEYEGGEFRELAQWDNMRLLSIGFI